MLKLLVGRCLLDVGLGFLTDVAEMARAEDAPCARALAAMPGLMRAVAAALENKQASEMAVSLS